MHVNMYVCTGVYIYICAYVENVRMYSCVYKYIQVCVYACECMYGCIDMYDNIYTYIYICIYIYIYMHMHMNVRTHFCVYIHIYIQQYCNPPVVTNIIPKRIPNGWAIDMYCYIQMYIYVVKQCLYIPSEWQNNLVLNIPFYRKRPFWVKCNKYMWCVDMLPHTYVLLWIDMNINMWSHIWNKAATLRRYLNDV